MDDLRIPTADPVEALIFSDPVVFKTNVEKFTVTVKAENLVASTIAWDAPINGFDRLAAFFEELARDFRGWDGERVWRPREPTFRLSATHNHRSLITLGVHLDQRAHPDSWRISVPITVEPSLALEQAARDLRRFLRR